MTRPLDSAEIPQISSVLMCRPDYFNVEYDINPHMRDQGGALKRVDQSAALAEWEDLKQAFKNHDLQVLEQPAHANFPDQVFTANPSLPIPGTNPPKFVLSHMAHPERQGEVELVSDFYQAQGYQVEQLQNGPIEGMGDCLWHPQRRFLWAGRGPRTSGRAIAELADLLDCPVQVLNLVHPSFYHLDTALCLLDEKSAAAVRSAFDTAGIEILENHFERLIWVDESEALQRLAANAFCADGKTVFVPSGCPKFEEQLRDNQFEVVKVKTDEFLKSGGSIFCMKLGLYHSIEGKNGK